MASTSLPLSMLRPIRRGRSSAWSSPLLGPRLAVTSVARTRLFRRMSSSGHPEPPPDASPVLPMRLVQAGQKALPFAGNGGYVLLASGFLMTDPLFLRTLLTCGYSCLVGFHSLQYRPLKIPLCGSFFFVVVNAYFAVTHIRERFVTLTEAEAAIYESHFNGLVSRVDFKKLLDQADVLTAEEGTVLVEEGDLANLVIILEGEAEASVGSGLTFKLKKESMVGEISWMQGVPATAKVTALPGCKYIVWRRNKLLEWFESAESAGARKGIELKVGRELARKLNETTNKMVNQNFGASRQLQLVRRLGYERVFMRHLFAVAFSSDADDPQRCKQFFAELEKFRAEEGLEHEVHTDVMEKLHLNEADLIRGGYSMKDLGRLVAEMEKPWDE